jgi:hypothetical protein
LISRASEGADSSCPAAKESGSGSGFDFRTITEAVDRAAGGGKKPHNCLAIGS